ncbi:hypothetical protein [Nitratidesulfovibrio sp. 1201_IL3209]|uniref:hypothetical protein n=1 Tax=Nitratidesulfovibrio sp. 1201_IL3209 TaxID=3084053 RepID=UPI002FD994E1
MRHAHLHIITRRCRTGPVAVVRITDGATLDWRTVRVPSLALPSAELDAVARQALRHSFAGHGVRVCAQYWLRLPSG